MMKLVKLTLTPMQRDFLADISTLVEDHDLKPCHPTLHAWWYRPGPYGPLSPTFTMPLEEWIEAAGTLVYERGQRVGRNLVDKLRAVTPVPDSLEEEVLRRSGDLAPSDEMLDMWEAVEEWEATQGRTLSYTADSGGL
jgi:hypothetical protein